MSKEENHGESDHEEEHTSGGYKGVCDQMNEKQLYENAIGQLRRMDRDILISKQRCNKLV